MDVAAAPLGLGIYRPTILGLAPQATCRNAESQIMPSWRPARQENRDDGLMDSA